MVIRSVRHAWPTGKNFEIMRPVGYGEYTFLHFISPMRIKMDGEDLITAPHACIFYAPSTPQFFGSEQPIVHDWMHFSTDAASLLENYNIEENRIYYPAEPEKITVLFREIENEWFSERPHRDEALENLFTRFLIVFSRLCDGISSVTVTGAAAEQLTRVRNNILLHPERPWRVQQMAELAKMSLPHFFATYKQIYGTSPMNDLIEARINTAKNRLQSDTTPISLLAEQLGYSNPYHFIRQFRERTGVTPAAFRKNPDRQ